jgi:glutathione-regulated potassium-efflux system ancillary protein KefF
MGAARMILVIHAHPYPHQSRGTAALLASLQGRAGTEVRRLYELYPDFDIDVLAEQDALRRATTVVLLHPLYWYSVPALMKHWFDQVLLTRFAHGDQGTQLHGKACLWATVSGRGDYVPGGVHTHAFDAFAAPIEATVRYCGMRWLPPFVLHDPNRLDDAALRDAAGGFRARIDALEASPA